MSIAKLQKDIIELNQKKTDNFTKVVNGNISTTLKKETKQYNEVVKMKLSEKMTTKVLTSI